MVHDIIDNLHNRNYSKLIFLKGQIGLIAADPDRELYQAAILLKNLALVRKSCPMSADYMLEELMAGSARLKPIFQKTLSLYRSEKYDEAFRFFGDSIGSKNAKNFAGILSKLDRINPYELVSQIDVFINMLREKRTTQAMREAERNSVIATAVAACSVFALLLNFCVVVVFLDTLGTLSELF